MKGVDYLEGTKGTTCEDVSHILIPGRGRAGNGDMLTMAATARIKFAAYLYKRLNLAQRRGVIVVSGYKSPNDNLGVPNIFMKGYIGVPEADLMQQQLVLEGVPERMIRVERNSVDTAMNLVEVEGSGLLPDMGAVMIIAQRAQLRRIMRLIAPRILNRDYIGVIVPEQGTKDKDGLLPFVATLIIMRGIHFTTFNARGIIRKRTNYIWRIVRFLRVYQNYHTE